MGVFAYRSLYELFLKMRQRAHSPSKAGQRGGSITRGPQVQFPATMRMSEEIKWVSHC